MFLYDIPLLGANSITLATAGNFSGGKAQELLVVRGIAELELLQPDVQTGKLVSVFRQNTFGIIRSMQAFRIIGGTKDYVVLGSDSGKIMFLEFSCELCSFYIIQQATFGKSGCRRAVPGQYLCVEPKGRAVMIGAMEKSKFVFILNRDSNSKLIISSPLEAHKSGIMLLGVVALDVGFENPLFACLEADLETGERILTYYELDLGLNHVIRRWQENVDASSHFITALPGGISEGSTGVLIGGLGMLAWHGEGRSPLTVSIPNIENEDPCVILCSTFFKSKSSFFVLIQTERGDIFKVTLSDTQICLRYFDTIEPSPIIVLLRTGFLLSASEQGSTFFYQVVGLVEETNMVWTNDNDGPPFVRCPLQNLSIVDEETPICPITDAKIVNVSGEESPRFVTVGGIGKHSSLVVLRYGLESTELALTELPLGMPTGIWTLDDENRRTCAIVVSFASSTLVLTVGESVEEDMESPLSVGSSSLLVSQFVDMSILQVTPMVVRHVRKTGVVEWVPEKGEHILKASSNSRQVVVVISSGNVVFLQLDHGGALIEMDAMRVDAIGASVACIPSLNEGQIGCRMIAIACSVQDQHTVRLVLLGSTGIEYGSLQAMPASVSSLVFGSDNSLYVGMVNGLVIRYTVDCVNATVEDARTRFLGSRSISLIGGSRVLALGTRPYLQSGNSFLPINYVGLAHASFFRSEACMNGVVGTYGQTLRIFEVVEGRGFESVLKVPLKYTPRKLLLMGGGIGDPRFSSLAVVIGTETRIVGGNTVCNSAIQVVDIVSGEIHLVLDLEDGEAAFSGSFCRFHGRSGGAEESFFFALGTATRMDSISWTFSSGWIHIYRVECTETGLVSFTLVHKTEIEEVPTAMCAFRGRLLVGLGNILRLYDLGKLRLLRKSENRSFPSRIVCVSGTGRIGGGEGETLRLVVADIQNSLLIVMYKPEDNSFYIVADDPVPRWVSSVLPLDYDTCAVSDKFGQLSILRLPASISEALDADASGARLLDRSHLLGASNKVESVCEYYVGDTVKTLVKAMLVPASGREVMVYTTLLGGIGALVPFVSREDVIFFQRLEMHMRTHVSILSGRDHVAFRSSFVPVKNVVDGSLCEFYESLTYEKRKQIADDLERTPTEVARKIEDMRVLYAFQ